jgi:hypothetical protein
LANLQNDIVAVCTTNMLRKVEQQQQEQQKQSLSSSSSSSSTNTLDIQPIQLLSTKTTLTNELGIVE